MASCEGADLHTGVAKPSCAPLPIKPPLEIAFLKGAGPVAPLPIVNLGTWYPNHENIEDTVGSMLLVAFSQAEAHRKSQARKGFFSGENVPDALVTVQ